MLEVVDLTVAHSRGLGTKAHIIAARNVSFAVERGRILGLIGESGAGKSTVLNAIAGLIKPLSGQILFDGKDVSTPAKRRRGGLYRQSAMLFQSAAVNPKMRVLDIVAEPLRNTGNFSSAHIQQRVTELLELLCLPADFITRYPRELSGGQLQRVSIARALALQPALLLADEPVTALDISVKEQILALLRDLCSELHIACVFVTHDLSAAQKLCDNFCIMRQGKIIEEGDAEDIFQQPENPYTRLLISSILPQTAQPSLWRQYLAEGNC